MRYFGWQNVLKIHLYCSVAHPRIFFLYKAEQYSVVGIYHICLFVTWWGASMFQLLWTTLLRTWVYQYLFVILLLNILGIPRSRISGSYGSSIVKFGRKCYTVFHSGHNFLHFCQFLSTAHTSSNFWTFLPTFVIVCFLKLLSK